MAEIDGLKGKEENEIKKNGNVGIKQHVTTVCLYCVLFFFCVQLSFFIH